MMKFKADPIRIMLEVGSDLFPEVNVEVCLHSDDHPQHPSKGRRKRLGFCEDYLIAGVKSCVISLNVEGQGFAELIDTLAHEIAHAGAGTDQGHGKVWKQAYNRIVLEYNNRIATLVDGLETGPVGCVVVKLKVKK